MQNKIEDTQKYVWSYCASVALFLAPVIEYTGIYLELQGKAKKEIEEWKEIAILK